VFKDFPYAIVHFGGTFEVLYCADFTGDGFSLHKNALATTKDTNRKGDASGKVKQGEF
jgi:hypothetical protein